MERFDCHLVTKRLDLTHSTVDGAQRHETLHMVGEGATVSVPVGILSSLQDELLALEVMVLKTHPAIQRERERGVSFAVCPIDGHTVCLWHCEDKTFCISVHWVSFCLPCSFQKEKFETYAPLSTLMERMLSSPHS